MPTRSIFSRLALFSTMTLTAFAAGCSGATGEVAVEDDDLTSVTALSREVKFSGVVYVSQDSGDEGALRAVQTQTKTAFGPLREALISVNSRELKGVNPATFVKRNITVIDTTNPAAAPIPMTEVRYTYTDSGVVDKTYARRSSLPLAVMNPTYPVQGERVLRECTSNDADAREFSSSLWYVFNPSLAGCRKVIQAESAAVATERAKIKDVKTQVAKAEVDRLYVPIVVSLGTNKTNQGASYPEYQRLYAGGVEKDALVVSLVYGLIDHESHDDPSADSAWGELIDNMDELYKVRPGLKLVKSEGEGIASVKLASGKSFDTIDFKEIVGLSQGRGFRGATAAEQTEVKKLVSSRIAQKWLTFEVPVKVTLGNAPEKDFKQKIIVYFGADSDSTPHKFAIKNSDVFLYNGHSYIGFGPLDPSRFTAADFPKSYQILFIDGCVSYNYYEKDYIPLKEGGTTNLDLITNGLEAPSGQSGFALGRFLSRFLDGSGASYKVLLTAASATDSLRVVDGEVDNVYRPTTTPVKVR